MRHTIVITILFLSSLLSFAQTKTDYSSYKLGAPLDIPLLLSGNFAELRSHHFHAGLDFKTQGMTGLPIYAPADGYVSRINISTAGYGNALYIDHPELNLTTVYGHLKSYAPQIDSLAKSKHYELEKYNINFFPEKDAIKIKKGDIIAYSGNTGSSAGPHLHFETRDRNTQDPINPLFFGFDIKDTMAPAINGLRIYPLQGEGAVNQKCEGSKFYSVVYYSGKYHLKGNPNINAWGKIGFGISTLDYLDGSWSKCGIYSIELFADSQLVFKQEMDRISYSEMRYIDAHIDQETRRNSRVDYQYSFKAKPNNPLSIYKEIDEDGMIIFNDSSEHNISYRIKDTHGNTSELAFTVNGKKQPIPETCKREESLLSWKQAHRFETNQFQLIIPKYAFYEDQSLDYTTKVDSQFLAPVYHIENNEKPLNKKASVSIRPNYDRSIPIEKMVLCKVRSNNKLDFLPSHIKNGALTTEVYSFSSFTIACDTIAPTIKPVNIFNGKRFETPSTFGFKVKDNFTGLWDYRATIDGKWALFYFESKQNYIFYTIDPKRLEKGKMHQLVFEAWDATNNSVSYNTEFFW